MRLWPRYKEVEHKTNERREIWKLNNCGDEIYSTLNITNQYYSIYKADYFICTYCYSHCITSEVFKIYTR
jgi:hypothetical protein